MILWFVVKDYILSIGNAEEMIFFLLLNILLLSRFLWMELLVGGKKTRTEYFAKMNDWKVIALLEF